MKAKPRLAYEGRFTEAGIQEALKLAGEALIQVAPRKQSGPARDSG
jgi:hypothetical protein